MSPPDPRVLLRQHFGHASFLPGQEQVIRTLLSGQSAAAVFPTGGGKSLCYQLPALALSGTTVVVSPLIALMKDQIDALALRGVRAWRLDSSLGMDEYRAAMDDLRSGAAKLVYVAPERFNNERFRQTIRSLDVGLFAVDEAHCISEWGHNFRPDYLKLVRYARDCGARQILALTATATNKVLDDICTNFDIPRENAIRTPFYRSNLRLITTPLTDDERLHALEQRLRADDSGLSGATIIYVTRQRQADDIARHLADRGFPARSYHAGKKPEDREGIQNWFFSAPAPIVVATIAFGMGIDKSDIRSVIHYNCPKSIENYAQEIGRAGRDGEPADCELFACALDLSALENFVYGDTPSETAIRTAIRHVFGDPTGEAGRGSDEESAERSTSPDWVVIAPYSFSLECDMRQLVARTLLTYLELDGYLEAGTPFYSEFEFQPKVPSSVILESLDGEALPFARHLLSHAKKRRTWFSLDIDAACRSYGADRARALRALEHFEDQEWIELRAKGVRSRYRVLRRPTAIEPLVASLRERFAAREAAEIHRLRAVFDYVEADDCRARLLSAHFDETLEQACGICSWCSADQQTVEVAPRPERAIEEDLLNRGIELADQHPDALSEPRALTRFLSGLSSPMTSKARLLGHELFGVFDEVPFEQVLARVVERRGKSRAVQAQPGAPTIED